MILDVSPAPFGHIRRDLDGFGSALETDRQGRPTRKVEKIVKKIHHRTKKQWLYEVQWKGYDETSLEPKENIPRIIVELYEIYGDSSVPTTIDSYFEKSGIKYVNVKVNDDDELLQLPACSLEAGEQAYYLPSANDTCNTEKTKSRFYHRTGGVLVMGKPVV